jgi:hypothetical protein
MFGLHVLALYAWKRIAGIIEFDEGVYEEIQRRAASVPPAHRQAAIDAMVRNRRAIGTEVFLRKKAEEDAAKQSDWVAYLIFWLSMIVILVAVYYLGGGQ